jgi:acylphosphatase
MSDLVHLRALVHGIVQGVNYRAFTFRAARSLSIKGFVRNTRDGDVELEAEGERSDIDELLLQLKAGPPEAEVDAIDTEWSGYSGSYKSFDVRY